MKEVFENIIEKLEENSFEMGKDSIPIHYVRLNKAIEIVKKQEEQYNNGWIPCDDRLPDNDRYILLSFDNFSVPCVGRYEEDENGGAFYIGDEDETCISQYLFVNAWKPLPEPYKEV